MQLNIYSSKGSKLNKKISLEDTVFNAPVNEKLIELAVYIYQKNQRQSTAHAKKRSEVRGGGAKPWRQKGTGRARAGSIRSPIWKGGGVVFGPRKARNYKRKLNRSMKKAAIRSTFSLFAKEKRIVILEDVDFSKGRFTNSVIELTKKLPVDKKVLYIQDGSQKDLYLGCRNLKNINSIPVNEVNVYSLLDHDYLVILKKAAERINELWAKAQKTITKKQKKESKRAQPRKKEVTQQKGLDSLKLSTRVLNSLKKNKITTKEQLVKVIQEGKKISGVGEKSLSEIKKMLKIKNGKKA